MMTLREEVEQMEAKAIANGQRIVIMSKPRCVFDFEDAIPGLLNADERLEYRWDIDRIHAVFSCAGKSVNTPISVQDFLDNQSIGMRQYAANILEGFRKLLSWEVKQA